MRATRRSCYVCKCQPKRTSSWFTSQRSYTMTLNPRTAAILTLIPCAILTSCATKPEKIAPAYVSDVLYQQLSCEQLRAEQDHVATAMAEAYTRQYRARSNDTVGVLVLGLPVSTLSGGNAAAEIGRLKGEMNAIERAGAVKSCNLPSQAFAYTPPTEEPSKKPKSGPRRP